MRKVEDGIVMNDPGIAETYQHDYIVVEVKPNKLYKPLWLCDNYKEASKCSYSINGMDTMVIPGMKRMSEIFGTLT